MDTKSFVRLAAGWKWLTVTNTLAYSDIEWLRLGQMCFVALGLLFDIFRFKKLQNWVNCFLFKFIKFFRRHVVVPYFKACPDNQPNISLPNGILTKWPSYGFVYILFFTQVNNFVQKQVSFIEQNLPKWQKLKLFIDKINDTEWNLPVQNENFCLL